MSVGCRVAIAVLNLALFGAAQALAQLPVIESFSANGQLTCTNLLPFSIGTIEWASSPAGPWDGSWSSLHAVVADSNGAITVNVPMFYRVKGTKSSFPLPPTNTILIAAGENSGADSDFGSYSLSVNAFYVDRHEVTKSKWDAVYTWATNHGYQFDNPGIGKGGEHPVHTVNWYDCVKWCNARSEKEGLMPAYYISAAKSTNHVYRFGDVVIQDEWVRWTSGYRLPTEDEWEYAARGGLSGERFPWGMTIDHDHANYYSQWSEGKVDYWYDVNPSEGHHPDYDDDPTPYTSPVGSFSANGYGLYDMAGNVWEWCWNGAGIGARRGGGWANNPSYSRCGNRVTESPSRAIEVFGFRCVLPAPAE